MQAKKSRGDVLLLANKTPLNVVGGLEKVWFGGLSDADAFKAEDLGRVPKEFATKFDNGLGNCSEVSHFGLLKGRHHFPKSIVEDLLLFAGELVRAAELQDDLVIWHVNKSRVSF